MLDNLETFSQSIKASLMVLLLGVGIASVTDLQLNLLGSIIAVFTIAATCVGQIVSFCLLSFTITIHIQKRGLTAKLYPAHISIC